MALPSLTRNSGKGPWYPPVSYNLWLLFSPIVGQEHWHCDMKRGFQKARKQEPQVADLLSRDSQPQQIGKLAQQGVYEFYRDTLLLSKPDAVERVAEILQLDRELPEVQEKIRSILDNYHRQPILDGKNIIHLIRGDEGYPQPILMKQGNYHFNLFPAIDCIFAEPDGTIHILDFKTGKSDFDKRQAYVYLLAAQHLYPDRKAVASFYNLETQDWSSQIAATGDALEAIKIELFLIAQRHQKELNNYRQYPQKFSDIFPPNPGLPCRYCPVRSICQFSITEVDS